MSPSFHRAKLSSSRSVLAGLLLAALAWSGPAAAADWAATLPSQAVQSHLQGQDLRIVVVAAGDHAEVEDAAAALSGALRDGAAVDMVMDDGSLGSAVADLGDQEIVERAGRLPVDQVHVVRVFPGAGRDHSVVVSVYDTEGEVIGGFNADTSEPLGAGRSARSGISAATAAAVGSTASGGEPSEAVETFAENFVWFQDMAAVNSSSGAVVSRWSSPRRGRYGEELTYPEFYQHVGRDDLATQFEETQKAHVAAYLMASGGGTAALVGAVWAPLALTSYCYDDGGCLGKKLTNTGLAVGLAVGGSVIALQGFKKARNHPWERSAADERRLADEYNHELADELGIDEQTLEQVDFSASRPRLQMGVGGWAGDGSAGLTLDGRW